MDSKNSSDSEGRVVVNIMEYNMTKQTWYQLSCELKVVSVQK